MGFLTSGGEILPCLINFSISVCTCGCRCTVHLQNFDISQHESRTSAVGMSKQNYNFWSVTAPSPGRRYTLTQFQYRFIEIVRLQQCKHKTLTRYRFKVVGPVPHSMQSSTERSIFYIEGYFYLFEQRQQYHLQNN